MGKIHKPRHGSLAFRPRKRASRQNARITSWSLIEESSILGFAGYKAGMTHVLLIDDEPASPTKGHEIMVPVTVVETPSLFVYGLRAYSQKNKEIKTLADLYANNLDKKILEKLNMKKYDGYENATKKIESNLERIYDFRILTFTNPERTGFGKKKNEKVEIAVGGKTAKEKFEFCKSLLGKEINAKDVFKDGEYVDTISITKGKGLQGAVKRFGIHKQRRKATGRVRHVGTLGPWHPAKVMYTVPMAGQMGYHKRTELNKRILKVGEDADITPKGGFLNYGVVKNSYLLIKGSVGGPMKRLIKFRKAYRASKKLGKPEIKHISKESKQGA